jgi:transposase
VIDEEAHSCDQAETSQLDSPSSWCDGLLEVSDQTIYSWRRQEQIDRGEPAGVTTPQLAELAAARRRIVELETELAIHRRAAEIPKEVVPTKGGSRRSR